MALDPMDPGSVEISAARGAGSKPLKMSSTVTCPACASTFTLSDDLLQRKVAGNLMTVKCRHCSAEIALDATKPSGGPSHDLRRAPVPPRRRAETQLGLGPAPATARLVTKSATDTPLGSGATGTPLPFNATATPAPGNTIGMPRGLGAVPKTVKIEALPLWDDSEETVQINAPKLPPVEPTPKAPPALHLPRVPHPPRKVREEEEPELIEAEEIPPSSADAPTLDPPQLEAATAAPPSVELLDVDFDVIEEKTQVAAPRTGGGERSRTMPLFDMSAVLPVASDAVRPAEASPSAARAQASDAPVSVSGRSPESKARGRKFVVAPQSPSAEPQALAVAPPKAKRGGAALWFGLVAAAAGAVAIVGLRGHQIEAPGAESPSAVRSAEPAPSEATVAAAAEPSAQEIANPPASAPLPASSAAPVSSTAPIAALPKPTTLAMADTSPTVSGGGSAKRTPALEKPEPAAPVSTGATPAAEQPAAPSKPLEAHNAPPPAPEGTEFDRAAARNALASAAAQASACRKDGDPSGTATITITFAPSGRVTSANLQGPPFAGTATGGCIANTMRHATVPAFSGERVTVTKAIVVQ